MPVKGPVEVGLKMRLRKQEAPGLSWLVQAWPPVGKAMGSAMANGPVVVGEVRGTVATVRLVRVKRVGALALWTGPGPKSCVSGVRMRPVSGRPVPVRVKGEGVPEEVEVRVRLAVSEPTVEGVN